jgi:uncharacterized protein YndB with AHSA1/START domain
MLQSTLTAESPDGTAQFSYVVENAGESAVDLTFTSGQQFDIVVTDDGEAVWRWSDGRMFTQAIEELTLEPGDELSFNGTWENPDPGTYEVTGSLAAQSESAEATTTLTV